MLGMPPRPDGWLVSSDCGAEEREAGDAHTHTPTHKSHKSHTCTHTHAHTHITKRKRMWWWFFGQPAYRWERGGGRECGLHCEV